MKKNIIYGLLFSLGVFAFVLGAILVGMPFGNPPSVVGASVTRLEEREGYATVTINQESDFTFTSSGVNRTITGLDPSVRDMLNVNLALHIPATIGGGTVTNIGAGAFRADGVNTNTQGNVIEVILPESVNVIGNHAFRYNIITNLVLPTEMTTLGTDIFRDNFITDITLPGGTVSTIGASAFLGNRLEELLIPSNITAINANAFDANRIEGAFVIPNSVTTIGNSAFRGNRLTSLQLSTNPLFVGINNNAFENNLLTSIVIPNNIMTIGTSAFRNNELDMVTLSNELTSIGANAFRDNNLTDINIPTTVISILADAFNNNFLTTLVIPNNVTTLGTGVFFNNELASVEIGSGIEVIPNAVFQRNFLVDVIIPGTVKEIGNNAFRHNRLVNVTLGNGLESIGNTAFDGQRFPAAGEILHRNRITSVTIPNTLVSIGENAFNENLIEELIFEEGSQLEVIPFGAFRYNLMKHIEIPNSVHTIGDRAFASLFFLETVTIPASVTTLGPNAFNRVFSGYTTYTTATIFIEHVSAPVGWQALNTPFNNFVWGVSTAPEIAVTNPGGMITTTTQGATGQGTASLDVEVAWASNVILTLTHGTINNIIINGQSLYEIQDQYLCECDDECETTFFLLAESAARWNIVEFGGNTVVLNLSNIVRDLNIQVFGNAYTITYHGLGEQTHDNPGTFIVSTSTFSLNDPTNRAGWNFDGWWTTPAEGGLQLTQIAIGTSGNQVLHARWSLINYTITFNNLDGVNSNNQSTFTIETPTFTLNNPANRTGRTFDGWYYDAGFTNPATGITVGTIGNQTFHARWSVITFDIVFNNLKNATHGNVTEFTIETPTFLLQNPTGVQGWEFNGWWTTPAVGGTQVTQITLGVSEDQVLFARWIDVRPEFPNDFDGDINDYLPYGWTPADGWPGHDFPWSPPQGWVVADGFPWVSVDATDENDFPWLILIIAGIGMLLFIAIIVIIFAKRKPKKENPVV
ncbi:MAG: leucine-rich repeat protein [Firmicutes bacterium]|nr:leucine-rich repeat protein [Bacillota bacterium]